MKTRPHHTVRSGAEVHHPDDVGRYLDSAYHTRVRVCRGQHSAGPLLTHRRADAGVFVVDELRLPGELAADGGPPNRVVAVWPSNGRFSGYCGGSEAKAHADEVMLLGQLDLPYELHADDLSATVLLLDPALIAEAAYGVAGAEAPPLRFSDLTPVDAGAARLWRETVAYVRDHVLADDLPTSPLILGHAARLLAAATLEAFPHNASVGSGPYDRTDANPVLLRRAVEFMEANLARDIALADVAGAVHVSPRAVQYMFRRHLDTTPLQYLRRLRLQAAHEELRTADPGADTVTEIAARWGFAHTGRFAVSYRELYGRSPHETLRR